MQDLRKLPFFLAVLLCALAVAVELGANSLITGVAATGADLTRMVDEQLAGMEGAEEVDRDELIADLGALNKKAEPPGIALGRLALLDGLMLLGALLMAASLVLPLRYSAVFQAVANLLAGLIGIVVGFSLLIADIALLLTMVAMFLSAPFGTLAYLAIWGFFDRGGASIALSLVMGLKLGYAACLVIAQPRFVRHKGIVLIVLTSLVANVIVSFLHGFVPLPLVSITDALAAIIVLILGLVWAIFTLVFAIVALVNSVLKT